MIKVVSEININLEIHERDYFFSGFYFPNYESFKFDKVQFIGSLDLSYSTFNCRVEFLNMTIITLNIQNTSFCEKLYFTNVEFKNSTFSSNATFHNGLSLINCDLQRNLLFDNCTFNNINETSSCEIGIKQCKSVHYLSFEGSLIKPRVFISKSSFDYELNFNQCTIENEFLFEQSRINGTISFKEAEFSLKENVNPMMSGTHFENIELSEKGRIIFKGKYPQDDMIKNELSIHFKDEPKGLISFENFNLNKIYPKFKARLFELEKEGVVEIGKGCRKYYCQTEIFTITASKATQTLVLDIVKIFCNYFELQENSNLGIEIVERNKSLIRYFYFTDEEISYDKFLEKINHTEYNLWETFSNLSKYSINSIEDIEKRNLLIDIAGLFLKLGNYTQNKITHEEDIPKILNSISAKAFTHLDKSDGLIINIHQGESAIQTNELYEVILNRINSFSSTIPKVNLIMKVNQNFYRTIEKVINADNFIEGNKQILSEDKTLILEEANEIKNEQSPKVKESKWEKFLKKWAGTISEVATSVLKELIMPK